MWDGFGRLAAEYFHPEALRNPFLRDRIEIHGEKMLVFVGIHENIRGQVFFVLQSTCFPANDHSMELLVLLDTLKRGSASRVTACIPYFGYARQDRKSRHAHPSPLSLWRICSQRQAQIGC